MKIVYLAYYTEEYRNNTCKLNFLNIVDLDYSTSEMILNLRQLQMRPYFDIGYKDRQLVDFEYNCSSRPKAAYNLS